MSREVLSLDKKRRAPAVIGGMLAITALLAACGSSQESSPSPTNTQPTATASANPSASSPEALPAASQTPEALNTTYDEAKIIEEMKYMFLNPELHVPSIEIAKNPEIAKQLGAGPEYWQANIDVANLIIATGDKIKQTAANPDDGSWGWFGYGEYFFAKEVLPLYAAGLEMSKANNIPLVSGAVSKSVTVSGNELQLSLLSVDKNIFGYGEAKAYNFCAKDSLYTFDPSEYVSSNPENQNFSEQSIQMRKEYDQAKYNIVKPFDEKVSAC